MEGGFYLAHMVGSVSFWKLGRIFPSVCGSQRIGSWITRIVDWSKEWTWPNLFKWRSEPECILSAVYSPPKSSLFVPYFSAVLFYYLVVRVLKCWEIGIGKTERGGSGSVLSAMVAAWNSLPETQEALQRRVCTVNLLAYIAVFLPEYPSNHTELFVI